MNYMQDQEEKVQHGLTSLWYIKWATTFAGSAVLLEIAGLIQLAKNHLKSFWVLLLTALISYIIAELLRHKSKEYRIKAGWREE